MDSNNWELADEVDSSKSMYSINHLENDALYFVRVSAVNTIGRNKIPAEMFEPVCPRKPVEIPNCPRNLRVKKSTQWEVDLEWDHSIESDVAQYFIDFKEENNVDYLPAGRVDSKTNVFTCDFLQKGRPYLFRIKAKNAAGFSKESAILQQPVYLEGIRDVPSDPLNLRLLKVDDGMMSISWMPPKYDGGCPIKQYLIDLCEYGSRVWFHADATDGNIYRAILKRLKTGSSYFVRVYAKNEIGISKKAAEFYEPICCIKAKQLPDKPVDIKLENVTSNSALISWSSPRLASGSGNENETLQYFIYVKEENSDDYLPVGHVDGQTTKFLLEYLKNDSLYWARVRAKNSAGFSEFCELPCAIQLQLVKEVPSSPLNLSLQSTDDSSICITWRPPKIDGGSQITHYIIEICPSGSNIWKKVEQVDAQVLPLECKISDLITGSYYFVRVSAYNEIGRCKRPAELYEAVYVKTPLKLPEAPSNFQVSEIYTDSILLTWDRSNNNDVEEYFIDMKKENDVYRPIGRVNGTENTFMCEFLEKNMSYLFRIRSRNQAGYSCLGTELKKCVHLADPSGSPTWTISKKCAPSEYFATIDNLDVGEYYFVKVYALNKAGKSNRPIDLPEPVCAKQSKNCPGTPKYFRVTNITSKSVTLKWESPDLDGSNDVVQYLIETKTEDENDFTSFARVDGRIYTYTCEYLQKKKLYKFRIKGKNSAGSSPIPAEIYEPVSLKDNYGRIIISHVTKLAQSCAAMTSMFRILSVRNSKTIIRV
ncbi:hypothetical protein HELRODRAFT_166898 [Helobdella robusta]|uniref:Fibronectin type-III domain-containing protein n=1 Tax=Helobdella robusta TaxID=6412 RepID=T1EYQ5_HELRO|nr:hypothetical protein HELRODRAFT_166898 [Helobdella robusta]ESO11838.1 hypothetical protein HELRODRAFT_166898 [Helobdella robusta]